MRHDIPIILLAAGHRLADARGRDKLTELIDTEPLLRRQARSHGAATKAPPAPSSWRCPPAPHPLL